MRSVHKRKAGQSALESDDNGHAPSPSHRVIALGVGIAALLVLFVVVLHVTGVFGPGAH